MKNYLLPSLLFGLLCITGCEKVVDFDLDEQPPKLVVEATIENDAYPLVFLSRSLNYFSTLTPELLAASQVRGAEVYVSDGTRTQRLREYSIPAGNGFSVNFYSADTAAGAGAFRGALKSAYTLRIVSGGAEYTATTTIPDITKKVDSVFWRQAPGSSDSNQAVVLVRVTDKPGLGDYIRYFTRRNGGRFLPALTSAYDDQVIDGKTYEIQVDPGVDRNAERDEEERFYLKGDTITFKLSNIDKATFDFWRTMEYTYASVGNPFSSPVKVMSNIKGDALGYFGGYATQYHTIVIPE
ncbi:MAG TPA: DUF4249 domain-containing protein [Chitinophagaceae bacterium]|nr:DUF4249 domain-containing protein [Chitinophagaceae bacterium]